MITILFLSVAYMSQGQEYKDWDEHDIKRFYQKIELDSYTLDDEGEEIDEIYIPTKEVKDGIYEIEVYKVSSKLYRITGTKIYMYFYYSPYLYSYDEGILEISGGHGTFYEKP